MTLVLFLESLTIKLGSASKGKRVLFKSHDYLYKFTNQNPDIKLLLAQVVKDGGELSYD